MALFLFLIDQIKSERGTPTIKIEDSWNVIQVENSLIEIKILFLLTYLNIKPQSTISVIFVFIVEYK